MKGCSGTDGRLFKWKMTLSDGAGLVAVICSWRGFLAELVAFSSDNRCCVTEHQDCFGEFKENFQQSLLSFHPWSPEGGQLIAFLYVCVGLFYTNKC